MWKIDSCTIGTILGWTLQHDYKDKISFIINELTFIMLLKEPVVNKSNMYTYSILDGFKCFNNDFKSPLGMLSLEVPSSQPTVGIFSSSAFSSTLPISIPPAW